ncbi:MAG: class I SAM-dependent methyltransferase [Actinomycetota bacterium]|nr:class I SAM-dependent methyltransferase [Actinomycetota bacterium]
MSVQEFSEQVVAFASAPSLDVLPAVVDVLQAVPPNPPEAIQVKFVGSSYEQAYAEAESFITVADQFSAKHGVGGFASMERIIDFGSGWGRITRTLLARTTPTKIFALDVDHEMTALLNTTLPGVNALTISPHPPTVLGDATANGLVAFSVFSHLSGPAHEAWAREISRLITPGGVVAFTVLDEAFFGQVADAQTAVKAGGANDFSASLAATFPDPELARRGYKAGEIQFAGTGGGEVRTGDYYGWAACPPKYIERVWGRTGLRIVEWVPSGVLFPQALVFLVADRGSRAGRSGVRRAAAASRAIRSVIRRMRAER